MFLRGGEERDADEVYGINEVKSDNTEKGIFQMDDPNGLSGSCRIQKE